LYILYQIAQEENDNDWEDFDLCLDEKENRMETEKPKKKVPRIKKNLKPRRLTAKEDKKKRRKARKAPISLSALEVEM